MSFNPDPESCRGPNQHLRHVHLPVVPIAYFKKDHDVEISMDVNLPDGRVGHIRYHDGKLQHQVAVDLFALALRKTGRDLEEALRDAFGPLQDSLIKAGVLEDPGPSEPMSRALWLRQNRNTGPARPSGASARRPRRHT